MKIVGFLLVIFCTFGGYVLAGGHLAPIMKAAPYEILIIMGCAIGAFIVANTSHTIKSTFKSMNCIIKPEAHDKASYMELLSVMYMLFKLARTKGWLALESHIEDPENSALFKQFPGFSNNHHAMPDKPRYHPARGLGCAVNINESRQRVYFGLWLWRLSGSV